MDQLEEFANRARRAQEAVNALGAGPPGTGKVELTDRERLIEVIEARWNHLAETGLEVSPKIVASLIADDVLSSQWKVERDTTMLARGKDAGYERALRDAISAVGEVPRCDYIMNAEGEAQLVMYKQAQRAVASLSNHGMEALFDDESELEGAKSD